MTKTKSTILYILAAVSLFVFTTGISYLVAGVIKDKVTTSTPVATLPGGKKPKIDPSIPRTEVCPLNGALFTEQERKVWEQRRPLAVMIENHAEARPLSGLGSADIVYEAVAEGGITRFMGIFYCGVAAGNEMLAPVRSARIYYTKLVLEYDALYNHVGGAGNCDDPTVDPRAKALCFIRQNKIKDLDQFGLAGDFKTCHRVTSRLDHEVAYEHTMACYTDELYKVAEEEGWTNIDSNLKAKPAWDDNFVSWKFKKDEPSSGTATTISFGFWNNQPNYDVTWNYDASTNAYLRQTAGEKFIDLNTDAQMAAKNVVVQFVKQTGPIDDHKHMYYEVVGTGKAIVFQDGKAITGTWSKTSFTARTKFMDDAGKEIQFNPGPIWIELVPSTNTIQYN
jgi:hypothetical protein